MREQIGKWAFSKDGHKLGEIIAVIGSEKAIVESAKEHVIVLHRRFFGKDAKIPILLKSIISQSGNKIIFDISSSDFKVLVNDYHHQKKAYKTEDEQRYQKRLQKGQDRGYYVKKNKGEW